MKSKRIENQDLLDYIKELPCISCEDHSNDVCGHHLKTVGSGGHDVPHNLMPLCKSCHMLIHQLGTSSMARIRPNVKKWLLLADWEYFANTDRWRHFKDEAE